MTLPHLTVWSRYSDDRDAYISPKFRKMGRESRHVHYHKLRVKSIVMS